MNFICAFLLLHMEEASAFWTLCYIIDDHMAGYYMKGMQAVQVDQLLLTQLVEEKLPELFTYLTNEGVMLQSCTVRWLLCIFVGVCPTETTARIWDLFLRDGRDTLIAVSYGLLASMQV